MEKWVVLTFYPNDTYTTTTYENVEDALKDYRNSLELQNKGYFSGRRYALVLEGSELPIKGYAPGEMAVGVKFEEIK